jgi:hypothetical protein
MRRKVTIERSGAQALLTFTEQEGEPAMRQFINYYHVGIEETYVS